MVEGCFGRDGGRHTVALAVEKQLFLLRGQTGKDVSRVLSNCHNTQQHNSSARRVPFPHSPASYVCQRRLLALCTLHFSALYCSIALASANADRSRFLSPPSPPSHSTHHAPLLLSYCCNWCHRHLLWLPAVLEITRTKV